MQILQFKSQVILRIVNDYSYYTRNRWNQIIEHLHSSGSETCSCSYLCVWQCWRYFFWEAECILLDFFFFFYVVVDDLYLHTKTFKLILQLARDLDSVFFVVVVLVDVEKIDNNINNKRCPTCKLYPQRPSDYVCVTMCGFQIELSTFCVWSCILWTHAYHRKYLLYIYIVVYLFHF